MGSMVCVGPSSFKLLALLMLQLKSRQQKENMQMRKIEKVIIHCSDTPESMDVGADIIDRWHRDRGWDEIGYHFVIKRDGTVEPGRSFMKAGAHTKGENENSLGVCLIGGRGGRFDYTVQQFESLKLLTNSIKTIFGPVEIAGHNEYSEKTCPNFNVKQWFGNN